MILFQMIVAFGVAVGLLAILAVAAFDKMRKRMGDRDIDGAPPGTLTAGLGIGSLVGLAALLARPGQNAQARMSLDAVVMVPTKGLRFISLGCSALILWFLCGPGMAEFTTGLTLNLMLSAGLIYAVLFIAGYEAKYNADGISAPNWLFQTKHYPWEEFISIKDNGQYNYVLSFESGRLILQKYLVGMATFLTFVSDVKKLTKSA